VIRALQLPQVDLLGFSIGGFQVQEVALRHPQLVRKLLLLGTGLRGGDPKMELKVLGVAPNPVPTAEDFLYLFFGRSEAAKQAGLAFWQRRHQRLEQDPPSSMEVAQAQADPADPDPQWRPGRDDPDDQLLASVTEHSQRTALDLPRRWARRSIPISRTLPETRDPVPGRVMPLRISHFRLTNDSTANHYD